MDTQEADFIYRLSHHQLEVIETGAARLPQDKREAINKEMAEAHRWLQLLESDLELRRKLGATPHFLDEEALVAIKNLNAPDLYSRTTALLRTGRLRSSDHLGYFSLRQEQALQRSTDEQLRRILEFGLPKPQQDYGLSPQKAAFYLTWLSPQERALFITSELIEADQTSLFDLLYAAGRILFVGVGQSNEESLFEVLDKAALQLQKSDKSAQLASTDLMSMLEKAFEKDSLGLEPALMLLNRPPVRDLLQKGASWLLPETDYLTLADVIISHPLSKGLFSEMPEENQLGFLLALRFLPNSPTEKQLKESFQKALSAVALQSERQRLSDGMKIPLNSIKRSLKSVDWGDSHTFNELLAMKRFGKLSEVWERLGRKKAFRKMFPRDELFWKSKLSFLDVYRKLNEP